MDVHAPHKIREGSGRPASSSPTPAQREDISSSPEHEVHGTHVSLYILGSSLFGAQLAAVLGLPYGFASHFTPGALQDAVAMYRREFRPSAQLQEPYVVAGVNVIAVGEEALAALESPAGRQIQASPRSAD